MKNERKIEIWWISEKTGEMQETLFKAIKVAIENLFRHRFTDFYWRRQIWDGSWHYLK